MACGTLASACAVGAGGRPDAAPPPSRLDIDGAVQALQRAEIEYDEGRYESASAQADSLSAAWRNRPSMAALADRALSLGGRAYEAQGLPGLAAERYGQLIAQARAGTFRDQAVERFVAVLADTGREPEAVRTVLENPGVLRQASLDGFRQWVSALSIDRLRGFANAFPPESVEADVVYIELAQLLIAGGDADEARRVAASVLAADPAQPERDVAELLAAFEGDLTDAGAKIGAILPLTGDLVGIGELLREGIELAVEGYRRARPDGFDLELVILDDRSDPDRTAGLVRELEREGVVAIVGPLRSESFATAARARRNPRLPIISPTATEVLEPLPAAYTLYDLSTRERDVAVDLARWTVTELGFRRVAILEPIDAASRRAISGFAAAIVEAGGEVVARARYDPTLTTFQEPIEALAAVQPDVVFAPAPTAPVVLSLAPQLFYYGLDRSIVLGSEAWADPAVLRRLESFAADHRVVGLWADRVSSGTRWQQFVAEYERTYRKSLRDNMLPALAYDATALVIAALEQGRFPIPAALSGYLATGPELEGVTGTLRLDPATSTVRRSTIIRMLIDGALVEAERSELRTWLIEARAAPPPFEREPFKK